MLWLTWIVDMVLEDVTELYILPPSIFALGFAVLLIFSRD